MADNTDTHARPGEAEAVDAARQVWADVKWSDDADVPGEIVSAVYPLIAAAVREQIAQDIEAIFPDPHGPDEGCGDCYLICQVARVARGSR